MTLLTLLNQQWWQSYPLTLTRQARELIGKGYREPAVISAQTACEIVTERAFTVLFEARGIGDLHDPLHKLIRKYSLDHEGVHALYKALTGDATKGTAVGNDLHKLIEMRNDIVHEGRTASDEQALWACDVADAFVTHIETIVKGVAGKSVI